MQVVMCARVVHMAHVMVLAIVAARAVVIIDVPSVVVAKISFMLQVVLFVVAALSLIHI